MRRSWRSDKGSVTVQTVFAVPLLVPFVIPQDVEDFLRDREAARLAGLRGFDPQRAIAGFLQTLAHFEHALVKIEIGPFQSA